MQTFEEVVLHVARHPSLQAPKPTYLEHFWTYPEPLNTKKGRLLAWRWALDLHSPAGFSRWGPVAPRALVVTIRLWGVDYKIIPKRS